MSVEISPERLSRWLSATPTQQDEIDRLLSGERPPTPALALEPKGEMLNKRELAVRLKLTVRTIENWQRRGVVPYVKVGRVILFDWPEILEHLKTNFGVRRRWSSSRHSISSTQRLPASAENFADREKSNAVRQS